MKTSLLSNPQLLSVMPSTRQAASDPMLSYRQTASEHQRASIFIKTKEGDTVRISENYSTMQKTAMQGYGDDLSLLSSEIMTQNSEFIQVKGDLNQQELADLGNLLNDLSTIAGDFFSGNFDDAVAGAMNLGDMGSLAKVDASFSNTTSLTSALTSYHPLPDASADLFNDLMAQNAQINDKQDLDNEALSINDRLKSQWQQFLGYLEDQSGVDTKEKHHGHHKHNDEPGAKAADVGQAMLARAKDTLQSHPRLSPHMPALGDLALDKVPALNDNKHARHDFIKDMRQNFRDAFSQWMV